MGLDKMPKQQPTDGLFKQFVQPGAHVLVRYGPLEGKTAVVTDFVDLRRVVVDGPTTGVKRQVLPIKWFSLTGFKCDIARGAKEKTLKKAMAAVSLDENWSKSKWAKKRAAMDAKKNMTDFQRFKLMSAQKKVNRAAKLAVKKMYKKK